MSKRPSLNSLITLLKRVNTNNADAFSVGDGDSAHDDDGNGGDANGGDDDGRE